MCNVRPLFRPLIFFFFLLNHPFSSRLLWLSIKFSDFSFQIKTSTRPHLLTESKCEAFHNNKLKIKKNKLNNSSVIRQKEESQNIRMRIRGKKCSIFGKFGVLYFLVTSILRFALLPHYLWIQKSCREFLE